MTTQTEVAEPAEWPEIADEAEAALEAGHLRRAAVARRRVPAPDEMELERRSDAELTAAARALRAAGRASKRLVRLVHKLRLALPEDGDLVKAVGHMTAEDRREIERAFAGEEEVANDRLAALVSQELRR